jgi:hypothetical protein
MAEVLEAQVFDIAAAPDPSVADEFDLLAIGTPVMGLRPTPEVHSFVKRLPECAGKKVILFCTYAIRKGGTLNVLEKELAEKGYVTIVSVSKRGLKPSKADFSDVLAEITKAVEQSKTA